MISLITDVSNVAEIRDMGIRPDFTNKGFGKKILDETIKMSHKRKIRKLYALIFPRNRKMYESFGFIKEGILKSHFAKDEDLVIMSLFLQ